MAPSREDLESLDSLVQTASALLVQLQAALLEIEKDSAAEPSPSDPPAATPSPAAPAPPAPLDALALAHDSASLIRAHATKLSLLIINEPFTPAAVSSVVRDLQSGPVPAMASAVQSCRPAHYGAAMRRELALRCRRLLAELHALLRKVPTDGKALAAGIEATAILWSACDDVVGLAKMGVGGLLADKTWQWGDLLTDTLDELKEWGQQEPDELDGGPDVDGLADQLGEARLSPQDMVDCLMSSPGSIPVDDPHRVRPRLESALRCLRLVTHLYSAARLRRFAKFASPPSTMSQPGVPGRLDQLARVLAGLPERFDDLALAFYELQPADIDAAMRCCVRDALAASVLLAKDWDGADDAFTQWIAKFQTEIVLPYNPST